MITQPSVTRGMKKLEQELGADLFNRQVNRITLNATGQLAAREAKKLLQSENDFTEKVLNFSKMQNYINIGSVAPGPLLLTQSQAKHFQQKLTFNQQLVDPDKVLSDLRTYKERLIFTVKEFTEDDVESMYLGQEKLAIRIDKMNPLSQKKSVTLPELAGLSFLTAQDIGPWVKIIEENIPNAQFLYQKDLPALDELTHYSKFPVFRSNLTLATGYQERDDDDRIMVPITGKNSAIELYGTYLKSQRLVVQPFLKELAKIWPQ